MVISGINAGPNVGPDILYSGTVGAATEAAHENLPSIAVSHDCYKVKNGDLLPQARHLGWTVALGLVIAGILGNLTDRLFRPPGFLHGHVVDFLQLPNFAIFNVADMCITFAAVTIVWLVVITQVDLAGVSTRSAHKATT